MSNTIKNITASLLTREASLIAVTPHNGSRIVVYNLSNLSLDIVPVVSIIISILGIILG
jgi:hypothetical protein